MAGSVKNTGFQEAESRITHLQFPFFSSSEDNWIDSKYFLNAKRDCWIFYESENMDLGIILGCNSQWIVHNTGD